MLSVLALDHFEILAEPVDLANVALDRQPLVIRKMLGGQPDSGLAPERVRRPSVVQCPGAGSVTSLARMATAPMALSTSLN